MFRVKLKEGAAFVALTDRLPWAYFAQQGVVFLKFGGFQRTMRFRGDDAASMEPGELDAVMDRLHDALRRVRGQISMHIEARRVPSSAYPGDELSDRERRDQWPDPISFLFDEERRDAFESKGSHFETERYITFVWKCSRAVTRRARSLFFTGSVRSNRKEGGRELHEFIEASNTIKGMLDGVMKESDWLTDDETFDFLHKTVSTNQHRVEPSYGKARIDHDVADCRLAGGNSPMLGDCHMRVISIKNSPSTIPAALAALDTVPFEHRYTIRWMGMHYSDGMRYTEAQLRDWNMLGIAMIPMLISYILKSDKQKQSQAANAMAEDAALAVRAVRSDEITIGQTNLNVVVWDRDLDRLEAKVTMVSDILHRRGLITTSYGVASLATWLGTLPGQIYADLRRPVRTSVNLSHFAPYSSVWSGDRTVAHLTKITGKTAHPLIIATTDGSTPFRVNLHTQEDLSHTILFGPSGNGKTTLVNGIIAAFMRYPNAKVCVFTIKGGGDVITRMLGGVTYDVGSVEGDALGFQPLAHADEPNERAELLDFVLSLLKDQHIEIDTTVREQVTEAIGMIAGNLPHRRTLTLLSAYLPEPLKSAVKHYTLAGGTYGKLLDDDQDRVALSRIMNFDMTELLKKPGVAPHVLTHLFRYIERRVFTGDPVLLVVDEAWRFLGDALFTAKFEEWLRAARSKNVTVLFATQNMKDAFDGTIGKVLADSENVPNIILLPNRRARTEKGRRPYEQLGFNSADIDIVSRGTPKLQYYFTCPAGRRMFDYKLGPLGIVLCGSTSIRDVAKAKEIASRNPSDFRVAFLRERGLHAIANYVRADAGLPNDEPADDIAMAAE